MARDRKTIKKEMTDAFISNSTVISLYGLTPGNSFEQEFSLLSIENILFDIISWLVYNHELIVSANAENSRPHTLRWYYEQCISFLDGLNLQWIDGQFKYDTTNVTDVEDRKIIDRCAVLESNDGELVIKVAKDNNGDLEPLSTGELTRFTNYMNMIKDAGNRIRIINQSADRLRLTLNVYVDVSIIDLSNGKQLNVEGDVYPVEDAVNSYLANLEFNGAFVKEFLKDTLKSATGVKLPLLENVEWKYASFDWATFDEWKVPEAGYFVIDSGDLTINYLNYALANN